jgi:hypothetical protein
MFIIIQFSSKIKKTELTLSNTRTRVKMNNESAEDLKAESEVKQGDPLTATLFSVVVDVILRQLHLRGNISTHLKQCLVYAGSISITTKQLLIDMFQKLKNQSIHFGFIVNQQNTEYLRYSKKIGLNDVDKDSKYLE